MHAGFGPVRASQTVGSQVSYLHPESPTHFFTGTAATCTSLFKPTWIDSDLPEGGSEPAGSYDPAQLFWRHERLHRYTLRDYPRLIRLYQDERDAMETRFTDQALGLAGRSQTERSAFSEHCFSEAGDAEERWLAQVKAAQEGQRGGFLYQTAWRGFNKAMPAEVLDQE